MNEEFLEKRAIRDGAKYKLEPVCKSFPAFYCKTIKEVQVLLRVMYPKNKFNLTVLKH